MPESRKQALGVTNGKEIQLLVRSKIWVKMSEEYHPDLLLEPKWLWVCVVREVVSRLTGVATLMSEGVVSLVQVQYQIWSR